MKRGAVILASIVFLVAGGVVSAFFTMVYLSNQAHIRDNPSVEGTLTVEFYRAGNARGEYRRRTLLTYSIDGQTYTVQAGYHLASHRTGQLVDLYYDPDNPKNAVIDEGSLFAETFPIVIGAVFFLSGATMLIAEIRKKMTKKRMLAEGVQIRAEIVNIRPKLNLKINNRHPTEIVLIGRCFGEDREFISDYICKEESHIRQLIEKRHITSLPVYVDSKNPKKYYVELSSVSSLL